MFFFIIKIFHQYFLSQLYFFIHVVLIHRQLSKQRWRSRLLENSYARSRQYSADTQSLAYGRPEIPQPYMVGLTSSTLEIQCSSFENFGFRNNTNTLDRTLTISPESMLGCPQNQLSENDDFSRGHPSDPYTSRKFHPPTLAMYCYDE